MTDLRDDRHIGEGAPLVPASGEVPVNPYSLLDAVNDASEVAHTGWLLFLGIITYVCIAVAGVTHTDLLLNSAVALPILQVNIELTRFFVFAPVLLLFLHFGLLIQHVMLARKVLEFDAALRPLEVTARRSHPLRLELHSYFYTQSLAGPTRSPLFAFFLHGMAWLSIVSLPVTVLLFVQVAFLPYHDVDTTWIQRIAITVDMLLVVAIGVFLSRREARFWRALGGNITRNPLNFLVTGVLFLAVLFFSYFVATIPDERLDQITRSIPVLNVERSIKADTTDAGTRSIFSLTAWLFEGAVDPTSGQYASPFQRNLIVTGRDLVPNRDDMDGEISINLRDRDLRYATLDRTDLHRADFTGAKLIGASLVGTDLHQSRLSCNDIDTVLTRNKNNDAGCTNLTGANLSRAVLSRSDLRHAFMKGARFEKAQLDEADLRFSDLVGADFSGADLRRASLSGGVEMMGATMLAATLQGADLTGAKLQGADLSNATLEGAQLTFVQAMGANFQGAELDAANLAYAKLQGADLSGASLKGVDLYSATIWATKAPETSKLTVAEVAKIRMKALEPNEVEALDSLIFSIKDTVVRDRLTRTLETLRDPGKSLAWEGSVEHETWRQLAQLSAGQDQATYSRELTDFLGGLSCLARFTDGSVAAGVIRRALAPIFKGDVPLLNQRLRTSCEPIKNVAPDLMQKLAAAAESLAPPPAPVVSSTGTGTGIDTTSASTSP